MRKRIAAFPQHYSWVRPEALEYFKSRLTQAPRDSQHGLQVVMAWCATVETQRKAFEALALKLEMLWVMIDTIHHAYAEP
jgi:pyrroloquinoline-quinone synthase